MPCRHSSAREYGEQRPTAIGICQSRWYFVTALSCLSLSAAAWILAVHSDCCSPPARNCPVAMAAAFANAGYQLAKYQVINWSPAAESRSRAERSAVLISRPSAAPRTIVSWLDSELTCAATSADSNARRYSSPPALFFACSGTKNGAVAATCSPLASAGDESSGGTANI